MKKIILTASVMASIALSTAPAIAEEKVVIELGHNGWVEGDVPCLALEFNATAAKTYAAAD
jgi:hypothetical protein